MCGWAPTGRFGGDVHIDIEIEIESWIEPRSGGRLMCSPSRYVRGGLPIALCSRWTPHSCALLLYVPLLHYCMYVVNLCCYYGLGYVDRNDLSELKEDLPMHCNDRDLCGVTLCDICVLGVV